MSGVYISDITLAQEVNHAGHFCDAGLLDPFVFPEVI